MVAWERTNLRVLVGPARLRRADTKPSVVWRRALNEAFSCRPGQCRDRSGHFLGGGGAGGTQTVDERRVPTCSIGVGEEASHVVAHLRFNHGPIAQLETCLGWISAALRGTRQLTLGCTGAGSTSNRSGIWPVIQIPGHLSRNNARSRDISLNVVPIYGVAVSCLLAWAVFST